MGLDQIGITLSGVIAVWLTQDKRATWQRWACIFGMVAQPFWFYAAWKAEQWGTCSAPMHGPEAFGGPTGLSPCPQATERSRILSQRHR
jgi:hypothetical protein